MDELLGLIDRAYSDEISIMGTCDAPSVQSAGRLTGERLDAYTQRRIPREYELRKHAAELKTRGLGSQAAQQPIKKVRDDYTTSKANIKAENLGKPGFKRRIKAESRPITFGPRLLPARMVIYLDAPEGLSPAARTARPATPRHAIRHDATYHPCPRRGLGRETRGHGARVLL
ncbi:hypothetical protein ACFU8W_44915 [Streptomyces sp. NPDC057565]|uniref:hypothetical protein n=1 Tax=Streptomyces sp. NPDC057565 TaxID=3346169 RepID=UPI0036C34F3B